MAPPTNESEAIYVGHTVAVNDLPEAIILSFFVLFLVFLALYVACCYSAFNGKLDLPAHGKSLKNTLKIKLVNPFTKKPRKEKDEDFIGIIMNDELSGDHTDTDTC